MRRSSSPNSQDVTAADRPQRADARRNRERLLAAAEVLFTEQGSDASLEEIARRAGVGIGTLYRHFPTRDDLIAQIVCDGNQAIIERAHELLAAPSPILGLTKWLEALVAQTARFHGLTEALTQGYAGASTSQLCSACESITAAGTPLIVRAQDAGELRADVNPADVILGANAAAWIAEQTGDAEAANRHLALMLDGLRCTTARAKPARAMATTVPSTRRAAQRRRVARPQATRARS